jgi:hypothetical protein
MNVRASVGGAGTEIERFEGEVTALPRAVASSPKFCCAVGPFGIALQPSKLIVTRRDLPKPAHVTLSWGNQSGDIDLHLTVDANGSELRCHESLGKICENEVDAFGHRFSQVIDLSFARTIALWKPVTPGWLWRRRYWIVLTEPVRIEKALRSLAPKSRGKYRINADALTDSEWLRGCCSSLMYKPCLLKYLTEEERAHPVTAIRTVRGRSHVLRLGAWQQPNGMVRWRALSQENAMGISALATLRAMELIGELVSPKLVANLDKLERALALDGVEFTRALMETVRQFVIDPEPAIARIRRQVPASLLG